MNRPSVTALVSKSPPSSKRKKTPNGMIRSRMLSASDLDRMTTGRRIASLGPRAARNKDMEGEGEVRKGTDHAVFLPFAGGAGGGPQPRPLHRLVRLVLPHLALRSSIPRSLARQENRIGTREVRRSGVEIPFSFVSCGTRAPRVVTGGDDNADKERERPTEGMGSWRFYAARSVTEGLIESISTRPQKMSSSPPPHSALALPS
jgi:hypothetical protein